MTSNLDSPDFTSLGTRAMLSLPQSPLTSAVAGVNSVVCDVALWARSLNLLVQNNTNVISLTVTGVTTGFVYLNAVPVYDGGIYYIPAMPVIDAQVTVSWYQVTTAQVTIYAVASDEPISVSLFNPVTPTHATSERLLYGGPQSVPANTNVGVIFNTDSTTKAVRCTVDNPNNYLWGRVRGTTTLTNYFDGSATNSKFPITPIPIDAIADPSILITAQGGPGGATNLYIAAINVPDFAGNIPVSNNMASNTLAPDPKQSETPNQLPVIFDGTIVASGNAALIAAAAGIQLRVHAISIMQLSAVVTSFDLQDTTGVKFFHYHYAATNNAVYIPLYGQLATRGSGLQLHNLLATTSGALGVTLWYSVL